MGTRFGGHGALDLARVGPLCSTYATQSFGSTNRSRTDRKCNGISVVEGACRELKQIDKQNNSTSAPYTQSYCLLLHRILGCLFSLDSTFLDVFAYCFGCLLDFVRGVL